MPTIAHVLETALYVDDLGRALAFYRDILGLGVLDTGARFAAIDAGQATILLLFRRGATAEARTSKPRVAMLMEQHWYEVRKSSAWEEIS